MRYLSIAAYMSIPMAFICHYALGGTRTWEPALTFALASVGTVPLAHLMGVATERLADRTGPAWGGLLNATFGNAAELIIGIIALSRGLTGIVKASLTGSILGNLLLVSGGAMVVGGWRRERQTFNQHTAETTAGLLVLAVCAMLFPALFHHSAQQMNDRHLIVHELNISIGTSVILLIVYGLGLLFTLHTHAHVFWPGARRDARRNRAAGRVEQWSVTRSMLTLLSASVAVAFVAELLVGAAEHLAGNLGWSQVFIGVVLLATIGNAAEHSTALILAHHDDMDTALTITLQSSLQIALFAVPVLVLLSAAASGLGFGGGQRMDLIFTPMEVVAVLLSVGIVVVLGLNGQTNWFEGVLLLAVYAILALAFFYIPASPGDREYHDVRGVQSPPRHTGGVSQPATHAAHRRRPAATTDGRD